MSHYKVKPRHYDQRCGACRHWTHHQTLPTGWRLGICSKSLHAVRQARGMCSVWPDAWQPEPLTCLIRWWHELIRLWNWLTGDTAERVQPVLCWRCGWRGKRGELACFDERGVARGPRLCPECKADVDRHNEQ